MPRPVRGQTVVVALPGTIYDGKTGVCLALSNAAQAAEILMDGSQDIVPIPYDALEPVQHRVRIEGTPWHGERGWLLVRDRLNSARIRLDRQPIEWRSPVAEFVDGEYRIITEETT